MATSTNNILNTAQTLSISPTPGQDFALNTTNSHSIFTFGNFSMEQNSTPDSISGKSISTSFTPFSTLGSFSSTTFSATTVISEQENQLNPKREDPRSYSYFGSFYTKVASSINEIIANFPYAILSNNFGTGVTVFDYENNIFDHTSTFKIPISGLTNQGGVIFASGVTPANSLTVGNNGVNTLYNNTYLYGIQLSGITSAITPTLNILDYSYVPGSTGYLNFRVDGFLFEPAVSSSTVHVYIRPTPETLGQYNRTLTNLENQLLNEQTFLIPDSESDTFTNQTFIWPKNIDGFNPDSFGAPFDTYTTSILTSAAAVDNSTTNWMKRTMIPENYTELDTDTQIYSKLINVYADEFDKIKSYIDNLAYMHNVTYNNEEAIPNNLINKLSDLLGFKFVNAFNNSTLFDYLGKEDADGMTLSDYNHELWKRLLININWIYKRKGTRDALMFIVKLIGTPDELLIFNEFVYNITQSNSTPTVFDEGGSNANEKINSNGYINYDASNSIFQEGGAGAGNGQKYLNQWAPEFDLQKEVDNLKIRTGDTVFGTESVVNTKELELHISPSSAIENDVFEWYKLGFGTWLWGSTGTTISPFLALPFSGMTVPFEWQVQNPYNVFPFLISGMTVQQWIDFVYATNIEAESRKVVGTGHNSFYMNLKKIYMTYMLWSNDEESNRLTFENLEGFLELIERNIFGYLPQLVPSTTILESALVYKNTVFNRQKFVYPRGINDGSQFKIPLPVSLNNIVNGAVVVASINNDLKDTIEAVVVKSNINPKLNSTLPSTFVVSNANLATNLIFPAFQINSTMNLANDLNVNKQRAFIGTPITFPTPTILVMA